MLEINRKNMVKKTPISTIYPVSVLFDMELDVEGHDFLFPRPSQGPYK